MRNTRNKLAAALLALFLGGFGAHWYYLGDRRMGTTYLVFALCSWVLTIILIGCFGLLVVGIACLYDFFFLLAMEPGLFDLKYNP